MGGWLYILASRPGGALYTGVKADLSLRVWQHKTGRGGTHTRRYGIDRLVYYEAYDDIRAAIQRERNMKHWPRAWKCNLILPMNPTWRDLYGELAGMPSGASDRGGRDEPGHDGEALAGTSPAMTP